MLFNALKMWNCEKSDLLWDFEQRVTSTFICVFGKTIMWMIRKRVKQGKTGHGSRREQALYKWFCIRDATPNGLIIQ